MAFATDLHIAYRNLGRNRKRTALAVGSIFIAQATVIFMSSFINGYQKVGFDAVTGPMLGHAQVHAQGYRKDREMEKTIPRLGAALDAIRLTEGVARATGRIYAPVLAALGDTGHTAEIVGVDLAEETKEQGLLESLPNREWPRAHEVLLGADLAAEMDVKEGDTLAVVGQGADGFPVSGLFKVAKTARTRVDGLNRKGILMPLSEAQELLGMQDQAHEIIVRVRDMRLLPGALERLKALPELQGLEVMAWDALQPQLAGLLEMMDKINVFILLLVFLTAAAGIANTMLMATFERSREFGMLEALGCRPRRLVRILLYESLFLGLAGVCAGLLAGGGLVWLASVHGIRLGGTENFSLEGFTLTVIYPTLAARDVVQGIIVVSLTSVLACLLPARRVTRLDPVEAMRA